MTSLTEAIKDPTHHRLIHGLGYIKLPDLTAGPGPKGRCYPPAGTIEGSEHMLQPPNGAAPMAFIWLQEKAAWFRLDSRAFRLAFSGEYLSSHGWTYFGPVVSN